MTGLTLDVLSDPKDLHINFHLQERVAKTKENQEIIEVLREAMHVAHAELIKDAVQEKAE